MNDARTEQALQRVVEQLSDCDRVLVITGAGVSADSGLPTYRGIGGLYEEALTEDNLPIEAALSGQMMSRQPEVTWKYIHQIESACRGARCNDAHRAISELEDVVNEVCVLTQNIDGFHRDAGSANLIEIHGNIHDLQCTQCARSLSVSDYATLDIPPTCDACGALIRPRVVLFGEMLPEDEVNALHGFLQHGVDMVLTIGTTSVFPYIAGPVIEARRMGIPTVEVNPGDSEVSRLVDYRFRDRAAVVLPELTRRLKEL